MPSVATLKIIGVGILLAIIAGGAWMLRDELIDKGMNLVYAQDNAAIVKAQAKQKADDDLKITAQNDYINLLQGQGNAVKEKIRVVQAPCVGDGANDPRLGDVVDWLRGRPAPGAVSPPSGQPAQGGVPPPKLPAPKR